MEGKEIFYNVLRIIRGTTVDGPGFRTSIYFAGCQHHCPECHNPSSWDPSEGEEISLTRLLEIINEEDFDVTLSGGDPLYFPEKIRTLIREIKNNRRNIWIYTGYTWEEILATTPLLNSIREADVLVDGKFIKELKTLDLPFRGSSNQRLIDIQSSLNKGEIILFPR